MCGAVCGGVLKCALRVVEGVEVCCGSFSGV